MAPRYIARTLGLLVSCVVMLGFLTSPPASAAPAAPAITSIIPGNQTLQVTFSAAAGAVAYTYTLDGNPGGPVTSPFTITGLTNGQTYAVIVQATDGVTSTPSSPVSARPNTPSAPTITSTSTTATTLVINYTPPVATNGAIVDYELYVNGIRQSNAQYWATSPFTSPLVMPISDLVAPYTISMAAVNGTGLGVFTDYSEGSSGGSTPPRPVVSVPGSPGITILETGRDFIRYRLSRPANTGGQDPYVYEAGLKNAWVQGNPAQTDRTITGLTPGVTYTIEGRARNSAGWGPWGSVTATTTLTVPSPPTSVSAQGSGRQGTVTWAKPVDDGGSPVTSYDVVASNGQTCTVAAAQPLTCTFSNLTPGSAATFSVRARNAAGQGPAATASLTTAKSLPGAPENVRVELNSRTKLTVRFDPPANDGGAAITKYTVTVTVDYSDVKKSWTCVVKDEDLKKTPLQCTISEVNGFNRTKVRVNATTSVGTGPNSPDVWAFQPPNPPTNVRAIVTAPQEITVFWDPPADQGLLSATNYTVTLGGGGISMCSAAPSAGKCTMKKHVDPFRVGQTYRYELEARNSYGARSTESPSVMMITTPGAPYFLDTTVTDNSITMTWSGPPNWDIAPVDGYRVLADNQVVCSTFSASEQKCTFASPRGVRRTLAVVAFNQLGRGEVAVLKNPVSSGLPTTPGTPVAKQEGAGRVKVTWSASTATGSAAVTNYVVSGTTPQAGSCTSWRDVAECVIWNLPVGTSVSYTVTPQTSSGPGATSAPSSPIVIQGVPGAPSVTTVDALDGAARIGVQASATGSAPTSYAVTSDPPGGSCTVTPPATSCVVSGLTNRTLYTFTAVATGPGGSSVPSERSHSVVIGKPIAPTGVVASASGRDVLVAWEYETGITVPTISGFTVTYDTGAQACTATSEQRSCRVNAPEIGKPLSFVVSAVNAAGSAGSSKSQAITLELPAAPDSAFVEPTPSGYVVRWAPASSGGQVSGYYVYRGGNQICVTAATTRECSVPAQLGGSSSQFEVAGYNVYGTGAKRTSTPVIPGAPGAPSNLSMQQSATSATFRWAAPAYTGAAPVSKYTVTVNGNAATSCTVAAPATTCTINGLPVRKALVAQAQATNSVASTAGPVASFTMVGPPPAPTKVLAIGTNGGGIISWDVPADVDSLSPVDSYKVEGSGLFIAPFDACTAASFVLACNVTDLVQGGSYYFVARAVNAYGPGPASQVSNIMTATAVKETITGDPSAPRNVTGSYVGDQFVVRWSAPEDRGGAVQLLYLARLSTASPPFFPLLGCNTYGNSCSIPVSEIRRVMDKYGLDYFDFRVSAVNSRGDHSEAGWLRGGSRPKP